MSKFAYLVLVSGDVNSNKYYRMTENGDNFDVEFGRVGSSSQKTSYPMSQWNKKFNEKVKKGYTDCTNLVATIETSTKEKYIPISDEVIRNIVDRLQKMARQAITENYTVSSSKVTQSMINEATNKLNQLSKIEDVEQFNKTLIELFRIIPRKMSRVSDYLIKDKSNIEDTLSKEQDLLDIMKTQVIQNDIEDKDDIKIDKTILDIMGLKIERTSEDDVKHIKQLLGDISNRYYDSWKVINLKTQEKFDKFIKEEDIKEIKTLWHGSVNPCFWGIICEGLKIKPSGITHNGSMFGDGCYLSNDGGKSKNYTSLDGSYWSGGKDTYGFMGLFQTAYGNPYDVYSFDSKYYNFNYEKLKEVSKKYNCLHAHKGSMLRKDEIIVYKPEQITIKYLVELR